MINCPSKDFHQSGIIKNQGVLGKWKIWNCSRITHQAIADHFIISWKYHVNIILVYNGTYKYKAFPGLKDLKKYQKVVVD